MKKMFVVLMIIALTFSLSAKGNLKLAWVNSEKITTQSKEFIKGQKSFTEFAKKKEASLKKSEDEIVKLEDEIRKLPAMVSKDAKQKKIETYQQKMQEYMKLKDSVQRELQQKQQELLMPIKTKILKAIDTISKSKGYDFVFDSAAGSLLFAKPEFEITTDVIKALNK